MPISALRVKGFHRVTEVIRAADLNAHMSRYHVDRLVGHSRIEVMTSTNLVGLEGDGALQAVRVDGPDGEVHVPAAALFSFRREAGASLTIGSASDCGCDEGMAAGQIPAEAINADGSSLNGICRSLVASSLSNLFARFRLRPGMV